MEYVHVACRVSGHSISDFTPAVVRLSPNGLISLINGLQQKNFGLDTLLRVSDEIRLYRERYMTGNNSCNLFVDSGGFSILSGKVPPESIEKFVECYTEYLIEEREAYNFIFSLDIPFFLRDPEWNTMEKIYELNLLSVNSLKGCITPLLETSSPSAE